MELGQTPLYSGQNGESIAVSFYTEIQLLVREKYSRIAKNAKINARFYSM